MVKTLQKHGNSQALVIEKPLMDALGIDAEPPRQGTVRGNSLVVTPVHVGIGRERVGKIVEELRGEYGDVLKRLAE